MRILTFNIILMNITFIRHSGFMVEMDTAVFLFDYFKGEIPEFEKGKPLVIFVSHKHPDHYNSQIFDLFEEYENVYFVLHKDCGIKWKIKEWEERGYDYQNKLLQVVKNKEYVIFLSSGKSLKIQTLKSTDTGVAYVLEYEGQTFYHAGDLGHWRWKDRDEAYNNQKAIAYETEMKKLQNKSIDVAFVPMDPRLIEDMFISFEKFLANANVGKIFPMHMWQRFELSKRFVKEHLEYKDKVVCITKNGEKFVGIL